MTGINDQMVSDLISHQVVNIDQIEHLEQVVRCCYHADSGDVEPDYHFPGAGGHLELSEQPSWRTDPVNGEHCREYEARNDHRLDVVLDPIAEEPAVVVIVE